ncbi:MAG: hypothetical protein Q7U04_13895, partial [Bacteriovorax sp.]|nr:hypothetical protein [Bacteriovorax sp.]
GTDVHERIFLCLLNKIPPIVLSDEHQDFKWIDVDKVAVKDFVFPTNFEAFQKAMEFVKK